MKERPIIFNRDMVLAILNGRKTQTRRVIRPQPTREGMFKSVWGYHDRLFNGDDIMRDHFFHEVYGNTGTPYGSIFGDGTADRLWVRETWSPWADEETRRCIQGAFDEPCLYRADYKEGCPSLEVGGDYHWKPSIFMPRKFSRITLELTDIRIERVQEITSNSSPFRRDDAEAEGCPLRRGCFMYDDRARSWFRKLWDSINAKRGYGWDFNPWIWVISFKKIN